MKSKEEDGFEEDIDSMELDGEEFEDER